jgi:hypothetical protein
MNTVFIWPGKPTSLPMDSHDLRLTPPTVLPNASSYYFSDRTDKSPHYFQ